MFRVLVTSNRVSSFQNADAIETGLSDFHCMIVTVLKGGFVKRGPKLINHRDYRNFRIDNFRNDVCIKLSKQIPMDSMSYEGNSLVTELRFRATSTYSK